MSYVSAIKKRDEVIVWERTEDGRQSKVFPAPYYFYTPDPDGEYTSMYGDKLVRHDFDSGAQMYAARGECEGSRTPMFESDIPAELKILSEHYHDAPAPNLHTTFLDIEVDYKPEVGFSSVANPYAEINAVALHHMWMDKHVLLIVAPPSYEGTRDVEEFRKELDKVEPLPDGKLEITFCENETDLLFHLLIEIEDADVLCGWNSDFFDIPYIGKRLESALGPKYFKMLSFPDAAPPKYRDVEKFGIMQQMLDPSGRISVDYMELFRKYEAAERASYKLETISEEILPEMRKLEYQGTLASLYVNDFVHFVRYNLRDTEILRGFEDRLGYVQLANEMYHMSTGLMKHVTGTIKLAELATNNFCHYVRDVIVPDLNVDIMGGGIQGAYVLLPTIGMHEYVGSMDIKSLYPSAIRAINISPETIVGQFNERERAQEEIYKQSYVNLTLTYENGTEQEFTADEWNEILKAKNWSISGYGTVFDQTEKGIVPSILEDWYAKRQEFQKMKAEALAAAEAYLTKRDKGAEVDLVPVRTGAGEAGFDSGPGYSDPIPPPKGKPKLGPKQSKTYLDLKNKAAYYDRIQYVYKIKLNSFYGALTNDYFRYNDVRMGESTTGCGRAILRHMCAQVCKELNGEYMLPNRTETRKGKEEWGYTTDFSVVYGDTDSAYFITSQTNKEDAIEVADGVAEAVNATFQKFMSAQFLCGEGFNNLISAGREIVSSRGLFVDKKRYVLHIVDDEGTPVDKLKVMGLDTKKTTLPAPVSKKLNSYVERLLKGERWDAIATDIVDFKDELDTTDDIMSIGLPKGVKKVEEYTELMNVYGDKQRLPGHVAAAIHYNQCLDRFDDKENLRITSGMKLKVFYLTQKYGRFKSIALPTDTVTVPEWFLQHFTVDRSLHIERLVDNPLQNIVKAVGYDVPSKQTLLVDTLLEF